MGVGGLVLDILSPLLSSISFLIPGETFPFFFTLEIFQRALVAALIVTIVSGFLGSFLVVRNMALMGDGLAHVSFGGVAVGVVLGSASPLWFALVFSVIASILIYEMQERDVLTGDASIAIFLTGMLALGLVVLRIWGGGITTDIEGYLFGNLLLIDESSLDLIVIIGVISIVSLLALYRALLAIALDPLAARIQGIPVRATGIWFSIVTAAVVVSMVQVVGTLLVTALLVTPAATAQLIGKSFKSCIIWTQVFGISSVMLGLYYSAELGTGSGSMIALVAGIVFASVLAISKIMASVSSNSKISEQ